jgi:hypothetical protein
MHLAVRRNLRRLPKRFPIGTTYVVEGHVVEGLGNEGGQLQVFSRYVVLPSGQRINLGTPVGAKNDGGLGNIPSGPPLTVRRRAKPPSPSPSITRR